MREVQVSVQSLDRFIPIIGREPVDAVMRAAGRLSEALGQNVVWNINSTAKGGGVAELLRPLVGYARGAGIDSRWLVIDANPEFFAVTKRLHHALHGFDGDGSALGSRARSIYESALRPNALALAQLVRPGDVVVLHDAQVAGLAAPLRWMGARVIWRCHVGADVVNPNTERAWSFLLPYLEPAQRFVFTRAAYVPGHLRSERTRIVPPSIDPFAPKNEALSDETIRAILARAGICEAPLNDQATPTFTRADGTRGRVDRHADVVREGGPLPFDTPLVVQVSRWDPLKDPLGVIEGFADLLPRLPATTRTPALVLAAGDVRAIADDPEGQRVFDETHRAWQRLPRAVRSQIHLVNLPMQDVEENAAMVNALQRHAAVIVQKSLSEGFGLTVTEAMWKGRPIVATSVGGIRDQIEDGVSGLLMDDPRSPLEFAERVLRLLVDPELAARLGRYAHEHVRGRFLGLNSLSNYAPVIAELLGVQLGKVQPLAAEPAPAHGP